MMRFNSMEELREHFRVEFSEGKGIHTDKVIDLIEAVVRTMKELDDGKADP